MTQLITFDEATGKIQIESMPEHRIDKDGVVYITPGSPPSTSRKASEVKKVQISYETYTPLNLKFWKFPDNPAGWQIVIIKVMGDGNCYFNAILRAINWSYITGIRSDGTPCDRRTLSLELRSCFAQELPKYYTKLSNGKLPEISRVLKQYTLESLQSELLSENPVNYIYNELFSLIFEHDIYLINLDPKSTDYQDIYYIDSQDIQRIKSRKSIILACHPGHYDLIGIRDSNGRVNTVFPPDNDLIMALKKRLLEKSYQAKN